MTKYVCLNLLTTFNLKVDVVKVALVGNVFCVLQIIMKFGIKEEKLNVRQAAFPLYIRIL